MQIEMHSPSFQSFRSVSSYKRARSPDSPSERPAKRLSLAIADAATDNNAYFYELRRSASSSRQSSEDWVKQAGGLSIESPLFPTPAGPEQTSADDEMAVDSEGPYFAPAFTPQIPRIDASSAFLHPHEALPSINIQPATPQMLTPGRMHVHESPTGMHSLPTLGSPTKRRFRMGPRANCEQCRMGVKGHWAHWD